ncbi:hypothetical protein NXF25_014973 [Crotalus adamanteus]|uniref:UPAR/Ly6 domain-containing protein n=1 Tax=Crotalus adamanteus TaxID=8729 RepID=A0AAW1AWV1_CROAD
MQLVECGADEKYCLMYSYRSTMTSLPLSFTAKSCARAEQCSNAYYGFTSVAGKYKQTRIACCENDGCNTAPLPIPGRDILKPNGFVCPGSYEQNGVSEESGPVLCLGDEDQCYNSKLSIRALASLKCQTCFACGDECRNEDMQLVECGVDEKYCLTYSYRSTMISPPLSFTAKSCAKVEQCSNAYYYGVTSVAGKYLQARVACCEKDGCNAAPLPLASLKCQTCFASGDKCRNEDMQLVECGMDEKYCLTFSFRSTMTPSPLSFTAKSCATVEQCSNAYYGVTSVARKYLQARIACCENDGCNTAPLPIPGRDILKPNGLVCPSSFKQNGVSEINGSILCLGDEDQCFNVKFNIRAAPSPLSFTVKSCAKAEQCSNAYRSVTSLAGKYQQKRIACCENDGCNTAPLPMSAYFSTVDAQGCTTKNSCSYPLGKVEEANGLILYDIETLECQNPEGLEGWRDFSKTFGWMASLKCQTCFASRDECRNEDMNLMECGTDEKYCLTLFFRSTMSPSQLFFTAKSCATAEQCSNAYYGVTSVARKYLQSRIACCEKDGCNTAPLPIPGRDILKPNGLVCPGSYEQNGVSEINGSILCLGDEDQCFNVKFNIRAAASLKCQTCFSCGDQCRNEDMQLVECGADEKYCLTLSFRTTMGLPPLSFTVKSCARAEQCSNAYYGFTSVAGKYQQKRIACCENDGCNTAPLPIPGRDILKPNGLVCPGSYEENGVSEESGPVLCLGDEDQCYNSKFSMRALAPLKCQTCFDSEERRNEDMKLVECEEDEGHCLTISFSNTKSVTTLDSMGTSAQAFINKMEFPMKDMDPSSVLVMRTNVSI